MANSQVLRPGFRPRGRPFAPLALLLLLLLLIVALPGCKSVGVSYELRYTWAEEPIPAEPRAQIQFADPIGPVAVMAAKASKRDYRIARSGEAGYVTSNAYLSDALVKQLRGEIQHWGGVGNPRARRSIAITVNDGEVENDGFLSIARLEFTVVTGDGVARELETVHSYEAPPLRVLDQLISHAAAAVLLEPGIVAYLEAR